jgi:hypothetical protein
MKPRAVLVLVALVAAGCQSKPKKERVEPPDAESIVAGKGVVLALKRNLKGALEKELPNGAAGAVTACHAMAPALAAQLARDGIQVGRVTRKPRNPKNVPAGWTEDALARFEKMKTEGKLVDGMTYARRLPDGRTAYAEPLLVQDMCLACHGTEIAPEVKAVLAEKYPSDQATGYAVGDLRGLAWVELPGQGPRHAVPSTEKKMTVTADQIVADVSKPRPARRDALRGLFDAGFKAGMSVADLGAAVHASAWLEPAHVRVVDALGGKIPVRWTPEDTVLVIDVLPAPAGEADDQALTMYLRIAGKAPVDAIVDALRGKGGAAAANVVHELAAFPAR